MAQVKKSKHYKRKIKKLEKRHIPISDISCYITYQLRVKYHQTLKELYEEEIDNIPLIHLEIGLMNKRENKKKSNI